MADEIDVNNVIPSGEVRNFVSHPVHVEVAKINASSLRFAVLAGACITFIVVVSAFFIYVYLDPATTPEIKSIVIAGFATSIGAALGVLGAKVSSS